MRRTHLLVLLLCLTGLAWLVLSGPGDPAPAAPSRPRLLKKVQPVPLSTSPGEAPAIAAPAGTSYLRHSDPGVVRAGLRLLAASRRKDSLDTLIAFHRSATNPELRRQALVAIQQMGLAEGSDYLATCFGAAQDPLERRAILAAFAVYPSPAGGAALGRLAARDPEEARLLASARSRGSAMKGGAR